MKNYFLAEKQTLVRQACTRKQAVYGFFRSFCCSNYLYHNELHNIETIRRKTGRGLLRPDLMPVRSFMASSSCFAARFQPGHSIYSEKVLYKKANMIYSIYDNVCKE
jgi:hypothetical protein